MKKFEVKKILIPIDFSETALLAIEHAVSLAKKFSADITLFHVIESITFTSAYGNSFTSSDFETSVQKTANQKLAEVANDIKSVHGLNVKIRSEIGRIYSTIVDVAEELAIDMVVMGTHGVSGFREFLIGSNAFRVVSESPCPVITTQIPIPEHGYKNIVIPIDDTMHSREKIAYVAEIAQMYGSTVHILGKPEDSDEKSMAKFRLKVDQVEKYFASLNIECTSFIEYTTNVAKRLLTFADEKNADLIIIMTEQEFDAFGLILGQAAQQIVNHSKIPVMSVRPDFKAKNMDLHGYGF